MHLGRLRRRPFIKLILNNLKLYKMDYIKLLQCLTKGGVLPKGIFALSGIYYINGYQLGMVHIISGTIRKDSFYLEIEKDSLTGRLEKALIDGLEEGTKWWDVQIETRGNISYLIRLY